MNLTIPSIFFGILLAVLYAAAFHFWRGEGLKKFLLYLLLSLAGFWGGHLLGVLLGWNFFMVGPLNAGVGTVLAILLLLLGSWLSRVQISQN